MPEDADDMYDDQETLDLCPISPNIQPPHALVTLTKSLITSNLATVFAAGSEGINLNEAGSGTEYCLPSLWCILCDQYGFNWDAVSSFSAYSGTIPWRNTQKTLTDIVGEIETHL